MYLDFKTWISLTPKVPQGKRGRAARSQWPREWAEHTELDAVQSQEETGDRCRGDAGKDWVFKFCFDKVVAIQVNNKGAKSWLLFIWRNGYFWKGIGIQWLSLKFNLIKYVKFESNILYIFFSWLIVAYLPIIAIFIRSPFKICRRFLK